MTVRAPAADELDLDAPPGRLLHSGDRMDQPTFHTLYRRTPEGFKAELVGGVVFLASPVSRRHGRPHVRLAGWLDRYQEQTPFVEALDNTTSVLGEDSEPQPDLMLRILPAAGGRTTDAADDSVVGAAELVVEVANSSAAIDLNGKLEDYERAGVQEYVVANAQKTRVHWFVRRGDALVDRPPDADGLFRSDVYPGLWLDPAAVFGEAKLLSAALRQGLATPEHAAFVAKLEAEAARRASNPPPAPEAES